jgi:hypothetical protein
MSARRVAWLKAYLRGREEASRRCGPLEATSGGSDALIHSALHNDTTPVPGVIAVNSQKARNIPDLRALGGNPADAGDV